MIETQLSTLSMLKPILVYDGHVIEFFFDELNGGTRRVHVGHIKSIEVVPVSHGKEKYSLQIQCEYQLVVVDVSEEALPKTKQLIAEVQKAMASFKS